MTATLRTAKAAGLYGFAPKASMPAKGREGTSGFRASFNSAPGTLAVEPSLLIDSEGEMHQIQQLLVVTQTGDGKPASVGWSLRRQGRV